jgi:hypothetical protein
VKYRLNVELDVLCLRLRFLVEDRLVISASCVGCSLGVRSFYEIPHARDEKLRVGWIWEIRPQKANLLILARGHILIAVHNGYLFDDLSQ